MEVSENNPIAVVFRESAYAPNNVPLLPTQLISSALDFLNCGVLLLLSRKLKTDGQVAGFYLIFYSIGRFVLEFFRGDLIRGTVGALTTSQFISVFTLAAGIVMVVGLPALAKKKAAGKEAPEQAE